MRLDVGQGAGFGQTVLPQLMLCLRLREKLLKDILARIIFSAAFLYNSVSLGLMRLNVVGLWLGSCLLLLTRVGLQTVPNVSDINTTAKQSPTYCPPTANQL